mgnify:CR=1 FL=1
MILYLFQRDVVLKTVINFFLKKYFTNLQSCVIIAIRKIGKIGDDLDE